jgi:hypothetical protein
VVYYAVVATALYQLSRTMIGLRFLFSAAIPDMSCFLIYGAAAP